MKKSQQGRTTQTSFMFRCNLWEVSTIKPWDWKESNCKTFYRTNPWRWFYCSMNICNAVFPTKWQRDTESKLLHNINNTESVCCNSKSTLALQGLYIPEKLSFDIPAILVRAIEFESYGWMLIFMQTYFMSLCNLMGQLVCTNEK